MASNEGTRRCVAQFTVLKDYILDVLIHVTKQIEHIRHTNSNDCHHTKIFCMVAMLLFLFP